MILHLVGVVLEVYVVVLFARALLSWFPVRPGTPLSSVNSALWRVTEPVLAPVRRVIPPMRTGNVGFDVSFLVVVIVMQFVAAAFLRA